MLPDTGIGLLIILLALMPGFVYQTTLRGWRGPRPDELEVNIRILRGVAGSFVFASMYAAILSARLLRLAEAGEPTAQLLREIAITALLLIGVIPWALATVRHFLTSSGWWKKFSKWIGELKWIRREYSRSISAWDHAFSENDSAGWIRVLLNDGTYLAGWRSGRSLASIYPAPHEIFLDIGYELDASGKFTENVSAPSGLWVRCDDIRAVEFIPRMEGDI